MLNKLKELREANEEGFTLIELLVVIVIIGILAAIALPIFLNQQKAAIEAGIKSDVRNGIQVVQTYLVKNPTAPASQLQSANRAGVLSSNFTNVPLTITDDETSLVVLGKWDSYTVTGTNPKLGLTYKVAYSSTTGKTVITP